MTREQFLEKCFNYSLGIILTSVSFVNRMVSQLLFPNFNQNWLKNIAIILLLNMLLWLFAIDYSRLYALWGSRNKKQRGIQSVKIVLFYLVAISIINQLFYHQKPDLITIVSTGFVSICILMSYQHIFVRLLSLLRPGKINKQAILVIGDRTATEFIDQIQKENKNLVAILSDDPVIINKYNNRVRLYSRTNDLSGILDQLVIDEVIYFKNRPINQEIARLIDICQETGVILKIKPVININYTTKLAWMQQEPVFLFQNTPHEYISLKLKRLMDILIAGTVMITGLPFFLTIAFLIKIDSKGPIFFKQVRVGLNGRKFYCYKFRSMVVDAEKLLDKLKAHNEQGGPVFKIKKDPRVTRTGRFLRKTSLDELPQFMNVLLGQMSVVGPRPPLPSEVQEYERWQRRRLSVKPGITCTWQVSGRNDIPFDEWMKLDIAYIQTWSLRNDLKIIFQTIKVVLIGDGQ